MQGVSLWEVLVNEGKEAFSNVCFHVPAVWRVIPDDVALSSPASCLTGCNLIWKVVTVTAFVECLLICVFCAAEALFVRGNFGEPFIDGFGDVTMGSFDGAETCELVGCYILSLITEKYGRNIGLYRDDGLAAFNGKPHEIEKIKKELCKIFRDNDLKITVEANKTKVKFLDVTLDLRSGKYWPYTKEGNIPLYVHRKSNHPPSILKNIPYRAADILGNFCWEMSSLN